MKILFLYLILILLTYNLLISQSTCYGCIESDSVLLTQTCNIDIGYANNCYITVHYWVKNINPAGPCSSYPYKNEVKIYKIEVLWDEQSNCDVYYTAYQYDNSLTLKGIYRAAIKCVLSNVYQYFNEGGTLHRYWIEIISPHCWDRYWRGNNIDFQECEGNPYCCSRIFDIHDHKPGSNNVHLGFSILLYSPQNDCYDGPEPNPTCVYICDEDLPSEMVLSSKTNMFDTCWHNTSSSVVIVKNPINDSVELDLISQEIEYSTLHIYNQLGMEILEQKLQCNSGRGSYFF